MGFETAAFLFSALGAAASVYQATQKPDQPAPPAAPTQPPQSQAASAPEQNVFKKNIRGPGAGGDPTLLTGPGGIPNDMLTLGKSTLLGS